MGLLVAWAAPQSHLRDRDQDRTPPPRERDRSNPPTRINPPQRDNRGRDRVDPPTRVAPPRRDDPPTRVSPPARHSDPPPMRDRDRSNPPDRVTPPQRSDPPSRVYPPTRSNPPDRITPPQRNDPPTRITPPTRSNPPDRVAPPQRNDPPTRITPPTKVDRDRDNPPQHNNPPSRIDPPVRNSRDQDRNGGPVNVRSGLPGYAFQPGQGRVGSQNRGGNAYGSDHNVASVAKVGPITIVRPPRDIRKVVIGERDRDQVRVRLRYDDWRCGYYWYDSRWNDDCFWFGYYRFNPWDRCCVSPWYFYAFLPGYISYDRCRFYRFDPWSNWYGESYAWRAGYYNSPSNAEIDYAVEDIVDTFQNADRRAASRLIPSRSDVAIFSNGQYSYSVSPDDFYDMFLDAALNTRTRSYQILDVRRGRDSVRVTARHEFEDPWGRTESVIHYYELGYEGRNLVITKFGVSDQRW